MPNETQMMQVLVNPFDLTMEIEEHLAQTTIDTNMYEEQPFTFLPRKKRVKARYITKVKSNEGGSEDSDNNISTEYETDDIQSGESSA